MSSLLNQDQLYNREERISYIYRWMLSKGDLCESEKYMSNGESFSDEQIKFIETILDEIETLEEEVKKHISTDWKFERFNYIERAVLINAAAELIIAKNKKSIVIDESLEYSKIYCGEGASPLINGILDKIG